MRALLNGHPTLETGRGYNITVFSVGDQGHYPQAWQKRRQGSIPGHKESAERLPGQGLLGLGETAVRGDGSQAWDAVCRQVQKNENGSG